MIEVVKWLIMPSNASIVLVSAALLFILKGRCPRFRIVLLCFGVAIQLVFSSGVVASLLLGPLEYLHPAVDPENPASNIDSIVILSGYASADERIPPSSYANSSSTFRLIEAYHLFSMYPQTRVIVTGKQGDVEILAAQLVRLGVPEDSITLETESEETLGSAENLRANLADDAFYLVTSAGHMPRAIALFRKLGMQPIPAPTDYKVPSEALKANLLPSAKSLHHSNLAVREYAGIIWYRLTGKI